MDRKPEGSSARPPLRNVTTHQLEYLVAASQAATMADAADRLTISPSALSQGLSELERRLGLPLFERHGRNRVLTDQGRDAVGHAERILAATADLTLWVDGQLTGERGEVRLGLIDIAAVHYFPDTLIEYRAERPDVQLRLTVAPSATLTAGLLDGRLDAAVIVDPPTPDRALTYRELFTEELAIYAPTPGGRATAGQRRARDRVGPADHWGPWVTFPAESHTRRHVATALRALGAEFRVEAESNQPEVLRQMVTLGMGWTVLPVVQAETDPNPLVRARRRPLLERRLVIARRHRATPGAAISALLERLTARAAEIER
ncbi:MAG: LysR family transcriptional regulator [Actinomycetota bacterium]